MSDKEQPRISTSEHCSFERSLLRGRQRWTEVDAAQHTSGRRASELDNVLARDVRNNGSLERSLRTSLAV